MKIAFPRYCIFGLDGEKDGIVHAFVDGNLLVEDEDGYLTLENLDSVKLELPEDS